VSVQLTPQDTSRGDRAGGLLGTLDVDAPRALVCVPEECRMHGIVVLMGGAPHQKAYM
jgi:hypothetical protein